MATPDSWVDGEPDESICGLAVPVRDRSGATIAALNQSLIARGSSTPFGELGS